jgi:phosphate:Na+ symporter
MVWMDNPLVSFELWAGLFGGLALFLFGMDVMTKALKSAAGDYMKDILGKFTRNRFVGVGMGAFVTAIIQSSSVTTVILVGFISAGLMSMSQSVAVIIGANIGTTITAQILAFKVTKIALPLIAGGFLLSFTAKRENWRQIGMILLGLGLVFYGMSIMSTALNPLRSYDPFIQFMISMQNPLLGVAVGALFTAVVQSSSATTGILIVMASQGLIGLGSAIAIALGANIGTCVTAGLASIGKPREAVRAAVVHTLFNVAGVMLWISFIPQLVELAHWMSPSAEGLTGTALLAADTPRQIANVHTFFNIANALIFVGFTTQIARLVEWMIPDRPIKPQKAMLPKYLDDDLLTTPSIALETVRLELRRLGKRVRKMVKDIMPAAISGTRADLERVAAMDKVVDALHIAIIEFLGKISLANLSTRQSKELMQLAEITNGLEQIGDRVATAMVTSAKKRIDEEVSVSPQTAKVLNDYHAEVVATLNDALKAIASQDSELAKQVSRRRKDFSEMSRSIVAHGLDRLTADEPNRLNTYAREMEVMEILDGVFTIARRIARTQR